MILDHAKATARRISELWPTITDEQLRLAVDGLRNQLYAYEPTNTAVNAMYHDGVLFFSWAELKSRIAPAAKVDPLTLPNSVETQRRNRLQEMQEQKRLADAWAEAEDAVKRLPEDRRAALRREFLEAQTDTLRKMYEGIFAKGKLPKLFVDVVYQMLTGRRVA